VNNLEAIVRAQGSGDLSDGPEVKDVDILRAVGCSGQLNGIGWRAMRALRNQSGADARAAADLIAERLSTQDLKVTELECRAAASAAVAYWLDPACGACYGRGYGTIPDTTTLSDAVCVECDGAGRSKSQIPKKIAPAFESAGAILDRAVDAFARSVARKLGGR
jgi:hypothetical protein